MLACRGQPKKKSTVFVDALVIFASFNTKLVNDALYTLQNAEQTSVLMVFNFVVEELRQLSHGELH